jgi:hypothetical protein
MNISTEKVKKFQELVDSVGTKPNFDNWKLRVDLIQEELNELKQAFEANDMVEVADAYGDIMFLVLGGVYKHGIPYFDKIFDEICDSNLSKSDKTLDDAVLSKEKYSKDGIETHIQAKDDRFIIRRNEDNKILKSHKYTPVSLEKYFTIDDLDQELDQILDEIEKIVHTIPNEKDKSQCMYYLKNLRDNRGYFDTTNLTMLMSILGVHQAKQWDNIKEKLTLNQNGRLAIKFQGFTR